MPTCRNCNSSFPNRKSIDGVLRNLHNRRFCLECSPFGTHNTKPNLNELEGLKFKTNPPKCAGCGVVGHEYFYQREGKTYSWCKECYNKDTVRRQADNKQFAVDYKGGKCQCCGYNKTNAALEFHHIDPNTKDTQIRFSSCSKDKLIEELDKCVLLCANCHREVHAGITEVPNNELRLIPLSYERTNREEKGVMVDNHNPLYKPKP